MPKNNFEELLTILNKANSEDPKERALYDVYMRSKSQIPYNNYFAAKDMKWYRKIPTLFTDLGISNCTLCSTHAYGDEYTRGSARTIVNGDPMYKPISGKEIVPGVMMIQSVPGVSDQDPNASYHSTIYIGTSPYQGVNKFGDKINVGDSLYAYSAGGPEKGQFRIRPKSALMKNAGKTRFRYYSPTSFKPSENKSDFLGNMFNINNKK